MPGTVMTASWSKLSLPRCLRLNRTHVMSPPT